MQLSEIMTKRSHYGDELATEIEKTKSDIDDVMKSMKEQAAQVADLAPRVWKIHAELCDVQAQLANPALSEEEKAGLREVEQQRMASQQLWSERLKAEQDKQIQLLTVLQQLLDKHKDLRAERAAQLNGKRMRS